MLQQAKKQMLKNHQQMFQYHQFQEILYIIITLLFINVDHPSNKSPTTFIISRTNPHLSQHHDNPYQVQRTSYSRTGKRAHSRSQSSYQQLRSIPSKITKIDHHHNAHSSPTQSINYHLLQHQLINQYQHYFQFSHQPTTQNHLKYDHLLVHQSQIPTRKKNNRLNKEIEIVSNHNTKIPILVHEGLFKSHTTDKHQEDLHIENPFNSQRKKHYASLIPFIKDYQSGYAPIDMQQNHQHDNYQGKTHFIRKKQSTLSLPRTGGVSYIKPSESKQSGIFQPLSPLIFQCSSTCHDQSIKSQHQQLIQQFINISENQWIPYILTDQDNMRNLLLGQKKGSVGWVKGVENCWPLLSDGTFILFIFAQFFPTTQQSIWQALASSCFKLGIEAKKSISGKKIFLKSIGAQDYADQTETIDEKSIMKTISQQDDNEFGIQLKSIEETKKSQISIVSQALINDLKDNRSLNTLSLRMEIYVNQHQWHQATNQHKNILNILSISLKQHLEKKLMPIITDRIKLSKIQHKHQIIDKYLKNIRKPNPTLIHTQPTHYHQIDKLSFQNITQILMANNLSQQQLANFQQNTITLDYETMKGNKNENNWERYLKMPLYYISTRDSFAYDLIEKVTILYRNSIPYKKIQYFFDPDNIPANFNAEYKKLFPDYRVGVVSYHDFFTNQQLQYYQNKTFETECKAFKNEYLQMTVQPTIMGTKIKRSKFFFGYRYMWTKCQLAEPFSYVGAGVRRDVSPPPQWIKEVEHPLVKEGILQNNFVNSVAINVYHDGKEGLAQHFDDAVRFKQPIYTIRLLSDSRLSFGSQFYGFCNGAFIIPLPRGCICVMEQNSYAANGIKHCIRPCDMTGKSATIILRQMHEQVVKQSQKYDELIDFPSWLSTLSSSENAMSYSQQKRKQAQLLSNKS